MKRLSQETRWRYYRKASSINRTKSPNLNVSLKADISHRLRQEDYNKTYLLHGDDTPKMVYPLMPHLSKDWATNLIGDFTETKRSPERPPWSSLDTLTLQRLHKVSNDDHDSYPDDLSVSLFVRLLGSWGYVQSSEVTMGSVAISELPLNHLWTTKAAILCSLQRKLDDM